MSDLAESAQVSAAGILGPQAFEPQLSVCVCVCLSRGTESAALLWSLFELGEDQGVCSRNPAIMVASS